MGSVTGKKLFSIMALCAMVAFSCSPWPCRFRHWLPVRMRRCGRRKKVETKVEKGRDVYYKTEGIVVGAPAPKTTDGPRDYPRYNFESRVLLWFANQQHLYYGSFVLAVPIFCMVIEFMGVVTKDKAMAKRYDQLAYDFIKISLTAYSLTAILGGILIFTFLTLYPAFFGYLSSIFRPVMHIYALMFVAESGTLYIYYYGWDKMKEGFLKWIHLSMSVVLNVIGTLLMFLANSWIGFMMSPAGVDEQGRYPRKHLARHSYRLLESAQRASHSWVTWRSVAVSWQPMRPTSSSRPRPMKIGLITIGWAISPWRSVWHS